MKTNSLLLADKYLGLPAGIVLNLLVRLAGRLMRIDHRLDRDFRRIAIVKYKGMGSILQAIPLITALKGRYGSSEITFITSIRNREVVSLLPGVDNAVYFDDRSLLKAVSNFPAFLVALWRKRFQLLFDLEVYSNISSIFSTMSCATNRFGYYLRSSQFRLGLYSHMMYYNSSSRLPEIYLQMAVALGIDCKNAGRPHLPVSAKPAAPDEKQPCFVINVNASDLRTERRWPGARFAELSDRLEELYPGHKQCFIGSETERNYVDGVLALKKKSGGLASNLSGSTSISGLISLMENASLIITGDTGPAHLAYALNKPAVVLFGPVSPSQFHIPHGCGIIYKSLYCSPCIHEFDRPPCRGDNQCMKLIGVTEVTDTISKVLAGTTVSQIQGGMRFTGEDGRALGMVRR